MFVSNPNLTNYFDKILNSNLDPYSSKCDLVIVQLRAIITKNNSITIKQTFTTWYPQ